MRVIDTVREMTSARPQRPRAVVMTMGALHAGHAALLAEARDRIGPRGEVLVTVFVNPLQFGQGEDFERYPRTWESDKAMCAEFGVDLVFAPAADDVFSAGRDITVDAGPLGQVLEGAARPGHFSGMLTIVNKLVNLTAAEVAVFGEKDYQQLVLIRRMVAQFGLPVEVVAVPTVREADGLALSSRNAYLSPEERREAEVIPRALAAASKAAAAGSAPARVIDSATVVLAEAEVSPDYVAVTGPDLGPPPARGPARVLVAARIGKPRLLDNAEIRLDHA